MIWAPEQDHALVAVDKWHKDPKSAQVFRLFGYAGTGKSTLIKHLTSQIGGEVLYAAYTGKAAAVLRKKRLRNATTIHRLIYTPSDAARSGFILNQQSDVRRAALVVIDECSMVNDKVGKDLESFGKKILVVGDPYQLPPVKGEGYFTRGKPDIVLQTVHRQAHDSPVLRLATMVRNGLPLQSFGGLARVLPAAQVQVEDVIDADQILCWKNETRCLMNGRVRDYLGRMSPVPVLGEKLLCGRNDHKRGLLNGTTWTAQAPGELRDGKVHMAIRPDDDPDAGLRRVAAPISVFEGKAPDADARQLGDCFTFGYAMTVHKAQGSQWENVTLFDENDSKDRSRWLYTGITRAASRITIVRGY